MLGSVQRTQEVHHEAGHAHEALVLSLGHFGGWLKLIGRVEIDGTTGCDGGGGGRVFVREAATTKSDFLVKAH